MTDWYRRKTWTKADEEEFFAKLGRARKDGRAQYLKIQAIELIDTEDGRLLATAEILLNKVLTDYPDDRVQRSQTFDSLGQIYNLRGDDEKALDYYRKALNFEQEFPNVITGAYLNYSETVVRTNKTELYDEVEQLLTERLKKHGLKFPIELYISFSVLSVLSAFKSDFDNARRFAELAEINVTATTNTLWNPRKKTYGVVEERITWLDRLVEKGLGREPDNRILRRT